MSSDDEGDSRDKRATQRRVFEIAQNLVSEEKCDLVEMKYGIPLWTGKPDTPANVLKEATRLKSEANTIFSNASSTPTLYSKALSTYREAASRLTSAYNRAPKEFDSTKLDPLKLALMLNISATYLKLSQWDAAEFFAQQALVLDPKNVKAMYRKASAQNGKSEFQSALEISRSALALEPQNSDLKRVFSEAQAGAARQRSIEQKRFSNMMRQNNTESEGAANTHTSSTTSSSVIVTNPAAYQAAAKELQRQKRHADMQSHLDNVIRTSTAPSADTPLQVEAEQLSAQLAQIERDMNSVLLEQVRKGTLVDLNDMQEDIDQWTGVATKNLANMTMSERMQLCHEIAESKKHAEAAASAFSSTSVGDQLKVMEREFRSMVDELKFEASRRRRDDDPNAEAEADACEDKLRNILSRLEKLLARFDFSNAAERLQQLLIQILGGKTLDPSQQDCDDSTSFSSY
ncbi:hypothetical protein Pelo_6129 [Pelomyxa schiedti]|nr:hypothetical protein Pelo_6129 [Pelomyxa schiedti]